MVPPASVCIDALLFLSPFDNGSLYLFLSCRSPPRHTNTLPSVGFEYEVAGSFFRWRSGGSLLGSRSPLSAAHRYGVFLCSSLGSTPLRDTASPLCYRIKVSMAWLEESSALIRCNCFFFFFSGTNSINSAKSTYGMSIL